MLNLSRILVRAGTVTVVAIGLAACDASPLQPGPTVPTANATEQPINVTPLGARCRLSRAAETAQLPEGCVPRRERIAP